MDNLQPEKQGRTFASQNDEIEINLLEIFYYLWDHLWQIVLSVILGAIILFAYDYLTFSPQYTAIAKVYVTSVSSNPLYNESTMSSGRDVVSDSKELLLTRPILEQVIDNLKLEISYQDLSAMVDITNPAGSRLLFIAVTGGDPAQVADIANQIASLAETELSPITNAQAPQIVESASVPDDIQYNPFSLHEGVKGGAMGGLLWCTVLLGWYFWKEYGDMLKRPEKISKARMA